jgi:hypothetical protein
MKVGNPINKYTKYNRAHECKQEKIRKFLLYVRCNTVIFKKYVSFLSFHVSSMKLLNGFKLNLVL